MAIIDQGNIGVGTGRAGDAWRIVKRPRRRAGVSLVDPKGRVFKSLTKGGLGCRPTPLAMPPASPRVAVLTRAVEDAVMSVCISRTGS